MSTFALAAPARGSSYPGGARRGRLGDNRKEAAVRQLTLRVVKPETQAIALPPDVEKAVVMQMAPMIVDLVRKQERSSDDHPTEQERRSHAHPTDQQ